jgi:hypothetical protein
MRPVEKQWGDYKVGSHLELAAVGVLEADLAATPPGVDHFTVGCTSIF